MPDEPHLAAILLAAGESTRMGRQKALLPWQGTTLLEYQLDQLAASGISEIIVVTGHEPDAIARITSMRPGVTIAHNADYGNGKAGSVRTGIAALGSSASDVLLIAVDQPRSGDVLRVLIEAHRSSKAPISAPVFNGRRGHPLMFARTLIPELAEVDDATQGVRAVLKRHAADINDVSTDDASVLVDLNRPGDLPHPAA